MAERIDREELRLLIREALKEALGTTSQPPLREKDREGKGSTAQRASPSPSALSQHAGKSNAVSRSTGQERSAPTPNGEYRLASGVLTEARVAEAGKTHRRIKIGAEVAVTPLARDRARQMKIEIVREKP
jgi:hypothetical protein